MDTAKYWIDPISMHMNLRNNFPTGDLSEASDYNYLKIRLSNGEVACVGIPWIDPATVELVGTGTVTLTIENVNPDSIPTILAAMSANGFNVSHYDIK